MTMQAGLLSGHPLKSLARSTLSTPQSIKVSTQAHGQKSPSRSALPTPIKVSKNFLMKSTDATENVALSKEYTDRTNPIAERQLVLASRRLAKTLQSIYGDRLSPLVPNAFLQ